MSARGARSRKVQQKDIHKKEKVVGKGKAPEVIYETNDAFAEWRPSPGADHQRNGMVRSLTVSSNHSHGTSRSSSTRDGSFRPTLNTLKSKASSDFRSNTPMKFSRPPGSATASDGGSSTGKDKTKFQAKGKETRAPRGRGGGVPIQKTLAPSPAAPAMRPESTLPPYSSIQNAWNNFRVWENGGERMRSYAGFDYDGDMQSGAVLIYFKEEQVDDDHPVPSLRADLDILRNAGSTWLNNALAYGKIEDNDVNDWDLSYDPEPRTPLGSSSPRSPRPRQQSMLKPTSTRGTSPSPLDIDHANAMINSRSASRLHLASDTSYAYSSSPVHQFRRSSGNDPTHEIWFTAPSEIKTLHGQRLHHVAIRNFLAMLHGKPIVGADLFEMLDTLQSAIQIMFDLDSDGNSSSALHERSVRMITDYLIQHRLDDVRSSVRHALGILAWSEQDSVRWRQGYLESFVHLAGIMTPEMEELADFRRLSIVTRRNLGLAGKTLQLHVMEAEEKLASFDLVDLSADTAKMANSPVYQSYQAFRDFLINHYARIHGAWPPVTNRTWLNRKIANALQADFGSLYDYIVDRDVIWNPREERASRKWEMAHRKNVGFTADLPELNITDMLVTFDAKHGFAHIPHPYPLLPREVPKSSKDKEKKSFFSSLRRDKTKEVTKDAKAHLQLSIVFSDATNIEKLGVNFNGSSLIDKFEQFELTTELKHASPREARLGRWILLYSILQVLSTLSVDVRGLKHTDGVRSFLCTDLKRMPEWVTNGQMEHMEANQQQSWCWQRAWDPMPTQTAPVELEASSSAMEKHGSQRSRTAEATLRQPFPSPPPNRQLPQPPPLASAEDAKSMQNDMHHLGEKIDSLSRSSSATHNNHPDFERHRDNEKPLQGEFMDREQQYLPSLESLRDKKSAFQPLPLRSHDDSLSTDLGAYLFSPEDAQHLQWPVPPGYTESTDHRESTILGSVHGSIKMRVGAFDDHRSPRRTHESVRL